VGVGSVQNVLVDVVVLEGKVGEHNGMFVEDVLKEGMWREGERKIE